MALQNFTDLVGPVVSASWLNAVDLATWKLQGDALGNLNFVGNSFSINGTPITGASGQFNANLIGLSGSFSVVCNWAVSGGIACIYFSIGNTGTSNTAAFTMFGLPAALQPANGANAVLMYGLEDNGVISVGTARPSGNTVYFGKGTTGSYITNESSWTASGVKGIQSGSVFTYPLT